MKSSISKREEGFSLVELLIVLLTALSIGGYTVVRFMSTQAEISRNNAAQLLAAYLERARVDSNRRQSTKLEQMASVDVIDNRSYVVLVDADENGALDPPMTVTIPATNNLQIKGPFPKTFRFDCLGRVVDSENHVVAAPLVIFSNRKGTSTVRLSQSGKPVIITGTQAGIGTWK
jgi:type II secretory pathway pseudopilin PulG